MVFFINIILILIHFISKLIDFVLTLHKVTLPFEAPDPEEEVDRVRAAAGVGARVRAGILRMLLMQPLVRLCFIFAGKAFDFKTWSDKGQPRLNTVAWYF